MQRKEEDQKLYAKLMRFCSYRERSTKEVREKAQKLGIAPYRMPEFIELLILEGFLDDSRFAQLYVSGKWRIKSWGKQKIIMGLAEKGISINQAKPFLDAIDPEDYSSRLKAMLQKKFVEVKDKTNPRDRLYHFGRQKGFEVPVLLPVLLEVLKEGQPKEE